ncbi:GNAT family N-acetyltransferase [Fulvivirga sp. 29W222]|uniref:GNAT family N-acetyltransferase n=1 Tax=Fulvivirga marina TaxID=2494733 RepID=A0A937KFP7_9BACT|nr:GNAT family N-acetyltransferase [Fulvivirga marina]MBL6448398.1 GNAT family N-acetyltransferase [Fulvivirga marina]
MNRILPLDAGKVTLRTLEESDADQIAFHANNPNIAHFTANVPYPYKKEDAIVWISKTRSGMQLGKQYTFGIEYDKRIVGAIGLKVDDSNNEAEVGYWLGEEYWNKGLCTDALQAVVRFGLDSLKLHKINGSYLSHNLASSRVLNKCGFIVDCVLKDHIFKNDKYFDLVKCYLLSPEK